MSDLRQEIKQKFDNGEFLAMNEATILRIYELCEKYDMSIYELSILSGVSQSTINEIVQGRSVLPKMDTIQKIAFGFGLDGSEFLNHPAFRRIKGVHDRERPSRTRRYRRKKDTEEQ